MNRREYEYEREMVGQKDYRTGNPVMRPQDNTARRSDSKTRIIIIVAVVVFVLLIGALIFFFAGRQSTPVQGRSIDWAGSTGSIISTSSKEINAAMEDAQKKVDEDDYESAYQLITAALQDYPDSQELQAKGDEYKHKRDEIENIIDQANDSAASSNFGYAQEVIAAGLKTYQNSKKLMDAQNSIWEQKSAYEEKEAYEEKRAYEEAQSNEQNNSEDSTQKIVYVPAPSDPNNGSNTEAVNTQQHTEQPSQEDAIPSYTFPTNWSGSYLGNTLDDEGNSIPAQRMVWFDLIEDNGQISGTCSVGMDDGSANVDGTFTVTGTYNNDTHEITINGNQWVSQGDLWGMRNFWGTVSSDFSSMSGQCVGTNSGKEGDWSVYS